LWHFVQAARSGSLTQAALRLGISTAALSKSISRLEKNTNTRLFVRTARHLQLTSEAADLLARINNSFDVIQDSVDRLRAGSNRLSGVVRLSTVTAYGKHCLVPLLPQFLERYPTVDVLISFHDGSRGLTRKAYDVRINWGEEREQDKVSQTLCQMPLVLVASPTYVARHGTPTHPDDLKQHDCINVILADGSHAHWSFLSPSGGRRGRQRVTFTPRGRITVRDELDAVADAAVAGLGITVISVENVLGRLRDGSLVRLLPGYEIAGQNELGTQIIMQYPRKELMSPRARALVDFILQNLKGRNPMEIVAGLSNNGRNALPALRDPGSAARPAPGRPALRPLRRTGNGA
jgi:DNA-binding transcriptional LysR family regulator